MEHLTWTAASRRHGIKRHQVREVLDDDSTLVVDVRGADVDHPDDRVTLVGTDATGALLEVAVVETEESGLLVIHAMAARPYYRKLYEEEAS